MKARWLAFYPGDDQRIEWVRWSSAVRVLGQDIEERASNARDGQDSLAWHESLQAIRRVLADIDRYRDKSFAVDSPAGTYALLLVKK